MLGIEALLVLHLISIIVAVAAVTIVDYVHFLGLRSRVFEVAVLRNYPHVSDIMTGIVGFVLLTTGLIAARDPTLLIQPMFVVKLGLITIAAINGFYLHHKFIPEFFEESDAERMRPRTLPRTVLSGSISITTWYAILIASTKSAAQLDPVRFVIGYATFIAIAFMLASRLERLAQQRKTRAEREPRITVTGLA